MNSLSRFPNRSTSKLKLVDHFVVFLRRVFLKAILIRHSRNCVSRDPRKSTREISPAIQSNKKRVTSEKTSLVIPIYNNSNGLESLLKSLCSDNCKMWHTIILVNDASTDLKIEKICQNFVKSVPNATYLLQENNQGFAVTANKGVASCTGNVILLNTDIILPKGALNRLSSHLDSNPDVATVTPITNNGFLACFPDLVTGAATPSNTRAEKIDRYLASNFLAMNIDIPSGVGFCMAINRAVFDEVGGFETHRLGYGEETAFCLIAEQLGWRNKLAIDVFVGHEGGVSFGKKRRALSKDASKEILLRFPEFIRQISDYLNAGEAQYVMHEIKNRFPAREDTSDR